MFLIGNFLVYIMCFELETNGSWKSVETGRFSKFWPSELKNSKHVILTYLIFVFHLAYK